MISANDGLPAHRYTPQNDPKMATGVRTGFTSEVYVSPVAFLSCPFHMGISLTLGKRVTNDMLAMKGCEQTQSFCVQKR